MVERRISYDKPESITLKKIHGKEPHAPGNTTIWTEGDLKKINQKDKNYDDRFLKQGFVIVTPMTIDENSRNLMQQLQKKKDLIPVFPVE